MKEPKLCPHCTRPERIVTACGHCYHVYQPKLEWYFYVIAGLAVFGLFIIVWALETGVLIFSKTI